MRKTMILIVLVLSVLLLVAGCKKAAKTVEKKEAAPVTTAPTDAATAEVADLEKDLQDIDTSTNGDVSDIDKDLGEFSLD